jgi:hypothetical protein
MVVSLSSEEVKKKGACPDYDDKKNKREKIYGDAQRWTSCTNLEIRA